MKQIKFLALMLISIIALASCQSSRYASSGLRKDSFLLTPAETKDFVEKMGFIARSAQLVIYENRPVWLVEMPEDHMIVEIYGFKYFVPFEEIIITIPSAEDVVLYHGNVINIRKKGALYLEIEK